MLSKNDAAALLALRAWTRAEPTDGQPERVKALRLREETLSPTALDAWRNWPADDLAAELDRWRPKYRIEFTFRCGARAFRWIKRRACYASRPCVTGLTQSEAQTMAAKLIRT